MVDDKIVITLTPKRYAELLKNEQILDALYAGGVDNWEWYGEALSGIEDEEDADEDD